MQAEGLILSAHRFKSAKFAKPCEVAEAVMEIVFKPPVMCLTVHTNAYGG